jgi:hypothetical protein
MCLSGRLSTPLYESIPGNKLKSDYFYFSDKHYVIVHDYIFCCESTNEKMIFICYGSTNKRITLIFISDFGDILQIAQFFNF